MLSAASDIVAVGRTGGERGPKDHAPEDHAREDQAREDQAREDQAREDQAGKNRADRESRDLQTQLAAAEAALRIACEKVAARDAFIAALSRELSNPLTPVTMAVERLRSIALGCDRERIAGALAMVERACEVFETRARSLLDVVEMTAASKTLDLQELDAVQAVRRAADRHQDVARRAGSVLDFSAGGPAIVRVNADALDRVLDHLLSNALKFGAGHPVHLSATSLLGHVRLCIGDQGPGIGLADRREIFDLLSRTRPHGTPGLGVGLWVSNQLTMAMGGSIEIGSKAPWTTCIELVFPTAGC